MKKRTTKQLIRALEVHKSRLGKDRDAFREIADEANGLFDSSEEAYRALEACIDALSDLV